MLAADLGVSRGTLRRAVGALVRQGVLTQVHGRGTFVVAFDDDLLTNLRLGLLPPVSGHCT